MTDREKIRALNDMLELAMHVIVGFEIFLENVTLDTVGTERVKHSIASFKAVLDRDYKPEVF